MTVALSAPPVLLAGVLWTVVCLAVSVALGGVIWLAIWLFRRTGRDAETTPSDDQVPTE